jgi:protein ImuB
MPASAALALAPRLEIQPREPALERDALCKLAAWAMRFTPMVSLDPVERESHALPGPPEPAGALLLEIAASLGLFGGAEALSTAAISGARERGHAVMTGIAPTARAALWLARSGQETRVLEHARLPGVLARLPIDLLGWPQPILQTLQDMGIRRIGECMRLPRDGLARRIGEAPLAEIDEALGRRPELRQSFHPAARFRDELDLHAETQESAALIAPLRVLLRRLEGYLRSRQAGAQMVWVSLRHRAAPATLLRIGLLKPSADAGHLEELAAIHLSASSVPAPVVAMMLEADVADASLGSGEDLLGRKRDQGERVAVLLDRLRMRLGLRAVHGIWPGREHRPERSWEAVPDPLHPPRSRDGVDKVCAVQRPLWILGHPTTLSTRSDAPFFHGPLTIESGPERIETGWWDGHDVRRDYYVARNSIGVRVWIFRDRRAGSWHLHGLFG